ncbi:hypothetical protein [Rhizobium leguminosarum]|uniref:hypothetical protein n=1 Tax=Rhizobium leguminosarum TaxID=384 RepID=UPI000B01ACD2
MISRTSIPAVTSSSASILGKNYLKQVDVIITDWVTGPELLISTKRMDSSYGKNAPNRMENPTATPRIFACATRLRLSGSCSASGLTS